MYKLMNVVIMGRKTWECKGTNDMIVWLKGAVQGALIL